MVSQYKAVGTCDPTSNTDCGGRGIGNRNFAHRNCCNGALDATGNMKYNKHFVWNGIEVMRLSVAETAEG